MNFINNLLFITNTNINNYNYLYTKDARYNSYITYITHGYTPDKNVCIIIQTSHINIYILPKGNLLSSALWLTVEYTRWDN